MTPRRPQKTAETLGTPEAQAAHHGAALAPVAPALAARLAEIAGSAVFPEQAPTDAAPYLEEPRGRHHGAAAVILKPADTAAVAEIITRCAAARVPVVPYGGGTGLVGGQVAGAEFWRGPPPVVLSLERMKAVRSVDTDGNVMIAEAGVALNTLQNAAAEADRLFPLSMASEGSCRLGGVLATNAGGVGVLRYGMARDLCLGVEAVLPDGSVLRGLKGLHKDNTGFDLRHLLIGSEGTLGVITAASLKIFPRPAETETALIALPAAGGAGAKSALTLLRRLQAAVGNAVSAFELIGAMGLAFLDEAGIDTMRPAFADAPPWMALVELGGSGVREPFLAVLEDALKSGLAADAMLAESEAQRAALWKLREEIPNANRRIGAIASHDVSTPVSETPRFIDAAAAAVALVDPSIRINAFGHLGDGNLHYNLFPARGAPRPAPAIAAAASRAVHDAVDACGGSISAEHGLGRLKPPELARYGDPAKIAAMWAIKRALDPAGIMNPGAVLPAEANRATS